MKTKYGIAVFDHPHNAGHPSGWRADEQGLINPNVSALGDWTLPANHARFFRYRLVVYRGRATRQELTKRFESFTTARDFSPLVIDLLWKELWAWALASKEPKLDKLSEQYVTEHMMGKWTVMFGTMPDKLTIFLNTNHLIEVSGRNDGTDWKKQGEWHAISDKLVYYLPGDNVPGFIFRSGKRTYILDPWAKTSMSELKREK